MGLISLLQSDPLTFALVLGVLLLSLAAHEWGHAFAALLMGDRTAQRLGRVTLNPLKHLDPIGALMLVIAGFGWAKPVPFDPRNFRNYRLGLFVVSIAGIVINVLIAVLLALFLRWLVESAGLAVRAEGSWEAGAARVAAIAASINLTLAVFNLLPIPPLDGSKILASLLPTRLHRYLWQLEANPYYGVIALVMFLTVLREPIGNLIGFMRNWFFGLFGL